MRSDTLLRLASWFLACVLGASLHASRGVAAPWDGYSSAEEIARRVRDAAARAESLIEIEELGRTGAGDPLWVARVGSGDEGAPALLLVAGLDGRHLHGTELALRHLEAFAAEPESALAMLGDGTLYIVPTLAPRAVDALRGRPARARATSPGAGDQDDDGLRDEDSCDDLDGDGMIRWVRVAETGGAYRTDPSRPEILVRAEREKGDGGTWRLLTEGRDDDGDREWNEEEDGGVLLSANFPFGYTWFARNRGAHQVSEPETRALADFLVAHREVGQVVIYGFEDNLLQPWPEQRSSDPDLEGRRFGRKPIDAPNRHDLPYFRELSERYLAAVGLDQAKGQLGYGEWVSDVRAENDLPIPDAQSASSGGFAAFAYYHRGLVALATPCWTPAVQRAREKADESRKEEGKGSADDGLKAEASGGEEKDGQKAAAGAETLASAGEAKNGQKAAAGAEALASGGAEADSLAASGEGGEVRPPELPSSIAEEAAFLDTLRARDPLAWKEWEPLAHPDFPDSRVEVGGYAPLARIVPPAAALDSLFAGHHLFVRELLEARPVVRIRALALERIEAGAYELRVEVENAGYLPDVLAQGVYSDLVRLSRLEIGLPNGGEVLGGPLRTKLGRLPGGGGSEEIRRILHLPSGGPVEVAVISEHGGRDARSVRPGERWRRP